MIERPEWQAKIAAEEATLAAADREAVAKMQQLEGPGLAFCRRALAIARVLLQETSGGVPSRGWAPIVISLYVHMLSVLRAALTLASSGHGRELPIMIRPALEALITMLFIAESDQELRATRWVDYTTIARQALMRKHADLFEGGEHDAVRDRIDQRVKELAADFPGRFWASGLGCSDLRVMAERVGLLWYYDAIYWAGSQPTHATAIAVEDVITIPAATDSTFYQVGLSGKKVHRNLVAYCDFLIRGLVTLNELFSLGIDEALSDLTREFIAAFPQEDTREQR